MSRVKPLDRGPLDWLRERRDKFGNRLISDEEYAAGERLRTDFEKAQMQPRVTASWTGLPDDGNRRAAPGTHMELQDFVIAAQDRVRQALSAVGTEHANVLVDVCCLETGLTTVEKSSGWPQRSGKIVLQMALRQLARHYGFLPVSEAGQGRSAIIRRWDDGSPRAALSGWVDHD